MKKGQVDVVWRGLNAAAVTRYAGQVTQNADKLTADGFTMTDLHRTAGQGAGLVAGLEAALRQGTPAGDRRGSARRPDAPVDHSRRHPGAHFGVPGRRQGDPEGHLEEPDPTHPLLRLDRAGCSGPGRSDPQPAGGHRRDERSGPTRRCRRRHRPRRLQGLDLDRAGLAAAVRRGTVAGVGGESGLPGRPSTARPPSQGRRTRCWPRSSVRPPRISPCCRSARATSTRSWPRARSWRRRRSGRAGSWGSSGWEAPDDRRPRAVRCPPGPLEVGERVTLSDPKGRRHSIVLAAGAMFHTSKGGIAHDELIGGPEGVVVTSTGGRRISGDASAAGELHGDHAARGRGGLPQGRRPDSDGRRHLPRCAGARGGRRLGCADLRAAAGDRTDRAALLVRAARRLRRHRPAQRDHLLRCASTRPGSCGSATWWSRSAPSSPTTVRSTGRCSTCSLRGSASTAVAGVLEPGGVICCYVATTPQLSQTVETIRAHGGFTEPESTESIVRPWHVEGLAVRPGHGSDRTHRVPGHDPPAGARRGGSGPQAPPGTRRLWRELHGSEAGPRVG